MAKLALPRGEVVLAMEELGLRAWIPTTARTSRVRITVHPHEVRLASNRAGQPGGTPEMARAMGLWALAAGAGAWASRGGSRNEIRMTSAEITARRRRAFTVALCGLGALAIATVVSVFGNRRY